ncbi:hypothetical protein THRCLA_20973 [Thraustotheca clavata]|uniref:START domain-containing protein n=1 Tax=Thraustotheca clavata TaxID=74557 RepID=A0A1W0A1H1_9STRA|nr:hypothetical protein THRCLA_20973 [Thraustotheca clavata]
MNASEMLIADMMDLSHCDYSLQWSSCEEEMLDLLCKSPPRSPPPSDRKQILYRHRQKKRFEREELKRAVVELEAKLLKLQQAKESESSQAANPPSKWSILASSEAARELASRNENKMLKELVQAHMTTAQNLANMLERSRDRSPTLSLFTEPSEQWKNLVLVKEPNFRLAGIHNILDREYAKLSSAFIASGLIDATEEIHKHVCKYVHSNTMEFHTIVHRQTPLSLQAVLQGVKEVIWGTVPIEEFSRQCKELIHLDDDTAYATGLYDHPLGQFQRKILTKVYCTPDEKDKKCTVVSRSIDEDELHPYNPSFLYAREVSWLTLEALDDGSTSIKFFQKFRPSKWTLNAPVSSKCIEKFDAHSKTLRTLAQNYVDHGQNGSKDNPNEAFVLGMLDPVCYDYSLEWSSEERDMITSLCQDESPPTSVKDDDTASVVSSTTTSVASQPEKRQALAMKRHRKKKREEYNQLKRAAFDLEAKLMELQQSKAMNDMLQPPTKWKQLATNEAKLEQKAKLENKQLKELVQEHMATAQAFANLLEKTWHHTRVKTFTESPSDKWKQLVLVREPALRTIAMNNMLDQEYAKMNSAYVEAGLIDATLGLQQHISRYTHNNSLEFHTIVCRHTPLPLHGVIEGSWLVLRGTASIQDFNRYCKSYVEVDGITTYVDGWFVHPLGHFQRRTLMRKYYESTAEGREKCTIVCRSIEEDELAPYDPHTPYANEVSWNLLEAHPDGGTIVKFFQKFRPSRWTASTPMSTQWQATFDAHSKMIGTSVEEYIDGIAAAKSIALKKHRNKKRKEHEELKQAAKELEEKLNRLQQAKVLRNILQPPSKWQKLARSEAKLKHEATVENKQLRAMVQEHMVTAQTFANLLEKTTKQSKALSFVANDADKWKQLILVRDPSLRVLAIHQIMDREYEKIDSAFVEAGLIDATCEVQKHVSKYSHNNTLEFCTIINRHANLPLHAVIEGSRNVIRGTVHIQNLNRYCKELVDIDANTAYVHGWLDHPLGQFQRRVICKQYIKPGEEEKRCITICRSIVEDELAPYDPNSPFSIEVSWTLLEANENGGTDVKYFQKFQPSAWTASTPMSSHWADKLEAHSKTLRHAVHQYLDHYGSTQQQFSI